MKTDKSMFSFLRSDWSIGPITAALGVIMTAQPAAAAIPNQIVLADFEAGVDSRGSLHGSLVKSGPHYAWENPPSPAGDDINYFDVTADADNLDEFVDYRLDFTPSDWRLYSAITLNLWLWSDGGGSGSKVRVYAHDSDGTGNSDGNGYHNLGLTTGPATFSLNGMTNRDRVDHILIRVHESFFGGVGHAGARQRTHLKSIRLKRRTEFPGSSELVQSSCLSSSTIKVCFDDLLGGSLSGVYNLRKAPHRNLILPTMGGSFQFALRSESGITACPQKSIAWGKVWNPTQAGCELCYLENGAWQHAASKVKNYKATSTTHDIEIRPRNYFHHDKGDCKAPLPYTTSGAAQENIWAKQHAELVNDYLRIDWTFENTGNYTHRAIRAGMLRHELPTLYTAADATCAHVVYEDIDGVLRDITPTCGTAKTLRYDPDKPNNADKGFRWSWFTIYDPAQPGLALTVFANTSLTDSSLSGAAIRTHPNDNAVQIDLSQYFAIKPNQIVKTSVYVLPYRWDEKMADNTPVRTFIKNIQGANTYGALSGAQSCTEVRGWARDTTNHKLTSVIVLDRGALIGDVPAALHWDNTVGDHGFSLAHTFAKGTHELEVLARDIQTKTYRLIASRQFTCP